MKPKPVDIATAAVLLAFVFGYALGYLTRHTLGAL